MPAMEQPELAVLTFNMLAPCYKRLHTPDGQEDRERHHNDMWTPRLDNILNLLSTISPKPDVIALQEFWFHPAFQARFERAMSPHYHIFYSKRPGKKEDGLATLIRRHSPALAGPPRLTATFPLSKGDRVGLAVSVPLAASHPHQTDLLVVNAHLTFPHPFLPNTIRPAEAAALTDFVTAHVAASPTPTDALVLGDFNGDSTSKVWHRMLAGGFESCYTLVNGPADIPATHFNHERQQVFVDHIFLRNPPPPSATPTVTRSHSAPTSPTCTARKPHSPVSPKSPALLSRRSRRPDAHPRSPSTSPVRIRDTGAQPARRAPVDVCERTTPVQCRLQPVSTVVYPEGLPCDVWPSSYTYSISDHRPVGIVFRQTLEPLSL